MRPRDRRQQSFAVATLSPSDARFSEELSPIFVRVQAWDLQITIGTSISIKLFRLG